MASSLASVSSRFLAAASRSPGPSRPRRAASPRLRGIERPVPASVPVRPALVAWCSGRVARRSCRVARRSGSVAWCRDSSLDPSIGSRASPCPTPRPCPPGPAQELAGRNGRIPAQHVREGREGPADGAGSFHLATRRWVVHVSRRHHPRRRTRNPDEEIFSMPVRNHNNVRTKFTRDS
jgi:hypothetical protein